MMNGWTHNEAVPFERSFGTQVYLRPEEESISYPSLKMLVKLSGIPDSNSHAFYLQESDHSKYVAI